MKKFSNEDSYGGQEHQVPEIDVVPDLDRLVGAEVVLPQDIVCMQTGKVIGRVTDENGRPVRTYNKDPLLDTRIYEVIFPESMGIHSSILLIL